MSTIVRAEQTDTGRAVASAWALFLALGLLMVGSGLLGTLLGVRAELEDFGIGATGVVMAFYYAGFLVGSQITPLVIRRVGHIRVYAALASLASTAALVHVVVVTPAMWGAMRLLAGFCMAGLYVTAESWLNATATNATRGRLLSIYMIVLMTGIGVGQLLLGVADPQGFELFVVASVLVSIAVVPISLSTTAPPKFRVPERLPFRVLWEAAPLGIVGGMGAGMATGALMGMGAFYAASVGMSPERVALFMGAAIAGAIAWQWPIGALSDKVPRRRAIAAVTFGAAAASVVPTQLGATGDAVLAMMFVIGGLTFPLYSLNLSHINDVLPEGQTVNASSLFVFVTGVGAIAGPVTAAAVMASPVGDVGFFWVLAAIHVVIGVFALYRIAVRRGLPTSLQKHWVPAAAERTSAVLMRLTKPRRGNGR